MYHTVVNVATRLTVLFPRAFSALRFGITYNRSRSTMKMYHTAENGCINCKWQQTRMSIEWMEEGNKISFKCFNHNLKKPFPSPIDTHTCKNNNESSFKKNSYNYIIINVNILCLDVEFFVLFSRSQCRLANSPCSDVEDGSTGKRSGFCIRAEEGSVQTVQHKVCHQKLHLMMLSLYVFWNTKNLQKSKILF